MMIRGIVSMRMARISDDHSITPALRTRINKAREESARGETVVCNTPEEMQKYFDRPMMYALEFSKDTDKTLTLIK